MKNSWKKTLLKPTKSQQSKKINNTAKQISEKLTNADRVPMLAETEAYITMKDIKVNFQIKYCVLNKSI